MKNQTSTDAPQCSQRLARLKKAGKFLLALVLLSICLNTWVITSTKDKIYSEIQALPATDFCLILGAHPLGQAFQYRIQAGFDLYKAGKVKHIIVSGDNSRDDYNEPQEMRKELLRLGVPASAITMDCAGFRTLDSVARAKSVFGVQELIVVTQEFHANRAVFLAQSNGLQCWAYVAQQGPLQGYNQTREYCARCMAVLDVWRGRKAHFPGPPENIHLAD